MWQRCGHLVVCCLFVKSEMATHVGKRVMKDMDTLNGKQLDNSIVLCNLLEYSFFLNNRRCRVRF